MTRPLSRRAVLPIGLSALLAGCGFHPIYAPNAGGGMGAAQAELAAISVGLIPDRQGQLLRQALQARFERGGIGVAHRYDLAVYVAMSGEGIGVQQDASVTRIRIIGTATFALTGQGAPGTALVRGTAKSVDGYDVINNQYFAADLSNDEVTRRLTAALADQITLQIASYFEKLDRKEALLLKKKQNSFIREG